MGVGFRVLGVGGFVWGTSHPWSFRSSIRVKSGALDFD